MPYQGRQPGVGVRNRFVYTATGGQTTFSGADSNGKTLAYQDGAYVDVYLNGVMLVPTTDFTATTKTSVSLTSGATASDIVEILAYDISSIADTVSKSQGGTFAGNVAVNGNLTVDTDTLFVDAANNRVGIGTSSPLTNLHVSVAALSGYTSVANSGLLIERGNGPAALNIASPNTESGFIWFADQDSASVGNIAYNHPSNFMSFQTNSAERMRIDSSGNVGVGTSSPAERLHVEAPASFGYINSTGQGTSGLSLAGNSGSSSIHQFGGEIRFLTGGSANTAGTGAAERMRIDSSGNLLVGTTSSAGVLTINGDQTYFTTNSATNSSLTLRKGAAGADGVDFLQCRDSANNAEFIIQGDGDAQNTNNSYGAISDAKLKENVTDATPKLDKLNQVRVVNYNLIGHERKQIGVIAQELEQIFPSMVQDTIDRDAEGNDLGTTTKSVKYSVFVPMLIKAMQEQQAIIEALEARITALEGTSA